MRQCKHGRLSILPGFFWYQGRYRENEKIISCYQRRFLGKRQLNGYCVRCLDETETAKMSELKRKLYFRVAFFALLLPFASGKLIITFNNSGSLRLLGVNQWSLFEHAVRDGYKHCSTLHRERDITLSIQRELRPRFRPF